VLRGSDGEEDEVDGDDEEEVWLQFFICAVSPLSLRIKRIRLREMEEVKMKI
jgi:hypothetical protein